MHGLARVRRRRARAFVLLGTVLLLVGVVAATGGSARAFGEGSTTIWPPEPNGTNDWYTVVPDISVGFDVDGLSSSYSSRNYDERLRSVGCNGPDYSGGFSSEAYSDVSVDVTLFGGDSSSPLGTEVACRADYERRFGACLPFIGCEPLTPWASYDTYAWSRTFKIDTTPPVNVGADYAPPNVNGWHNTASGVSFVGEDWPSGIAFCRSGEPFGPGGAGQQIGPPDGVGKTIDGGCRNNAGLETAAATVVYSYDGTAPTLAPTVSPNPVPLNGSATADPNASDNLSEIDTASCGPVDASTIGSHTVACTAKDKAGNTKSGSASYKVGYVFGGFGQPVDETALNVSKAGQVVPLKFSVADGTGTPVTTLASVTVTAVTVACDLSETQDQIEEYAAGLSGLQNLGGGLYQFNWKTPKEYANSCKTVRVNLGDNINHATDFRFTK